MMKNDYMTVALKKNYKNYPMRLTKLTEMMQQQQEKMGGKLY